MIYLKEIQGETPRARSATPRAGSATPRAGSTTRLRKSASFERRQRESSQMIILNLLKTGDSKINWNSISTHLKSVPDLMNTIHHLTQAIKKDPVFSLGKIFCAHPI